MSRCLRHQKQSRRFDRISRDNDVLRTLKAPLSVPVVMDARREVAIHLDAADHGEIADLGASAQGAWNPGDERALLGVGRATKRAEAAIDAGRRRAARRR